MTRTRPTLAGALLACTLLTGLLAGCGDDGDDEPREESGSSWPNMDPNPDDTTPPTTTPTDPSATDEGDYASAISEPREDSYYPEVGDPLVDALHYDLTLAWHPDDRLLVGKEVLTFRATNDADRFQLDFGEPLEVSAVSVDGVEVSAEKQGKDLVVESPVEADGTYTVQIDYSGTPEPVRAPTTRSDLVTTGFTIDDENQVWTMQEPYGAYTWYAVNDHPSDKALYDFTLVVPSPWTGIANGEQVSDEEADGLHTTQYHLAEPATSYLVTVAFGDYDKTEDTGPNGLPITYWTPRGDSSFDAGLSTTPDAIAWLEELLGPYPFDTAGIVVVDSESGMETQTMVTLGNTAYSTSPATVLHEMAHQWYGDQVSPNDWRDVWMNEGMAMYLQLMWEAEQQGVGFEEYLDSYRVYEEQYRAEAGPPGDFEEGEFGSSNIYISGAFLWQAIREQIGDDAFFRIIREWPASQDNTSSDRETLLAFLEEESGQQLDDVWEAWLLSPTSPE